MLSSYNKFVKKNIRAVITKGKSPKSAMKAVAKMWKKHSKRSGAKLSKRSGAKRSGAKRSVAKRSVAKRSKRSGAKRSVAKRSVRRH
jgi:hypothetical protein